MATLAQLVDDVVVARFELKPPRVTIGRHPDNDIQISEGAVSGHHAHIDITPDPHLDGAMDYRITDDDSKNGTFVNGVPAKPGQRLNHGDVVGIAWNRFQFIDEAEGGLEETAYILSD